MSLVLLSHMISHLKNCSRARLGTASIPSTKLHLRCSLALLRHGFLSRVDVAGTNPPPPLLSSTKTTIEEVEEMAKKLEEEPWEAYSTLDSESDSESLTSGSEADSTTKDASLTLSNSQLSNDSGRQVVLPPRNPAERRIWLDLKYYNNEPVIGFAQMVSRPTRRIMSSLRDIELISRGKRAGIIGGLTNPGDCLFFRTDLGVLESRECLEKKIGGMALFRIGAIR